MAIQRLLCAGLLVSLSACSASTDGADDRAAPGGDGSGFPSPSGEGAGADTDSSAPIPGSASADGSDITPPPPGNGGTRPGTLTAGTWDDNRNFDFFAAYRSSLYRRQLPGLLPFDAADHDAAHALFSEPRGAKQTLDVSFVIDTTGSMGDELRYLQTEFIALSSNIFRKYPNAAQRWSLVLYRDVQDQYVVRAFDFQDDPAEFQLRLDEQAADGGGDTPEAPDRALAKTAELAWRTGASTARLAFWVADAPHHDHNAGPLADAIQALSEQDVHIYPIASSGIDELTELSMRQAAQLTGGRYLFLTDDSGVGAAHKEPTIPCYFVTKLDSAIERMIDVELSGEYREPTTAEIIRRSGDMQNGVCTLESGADVQAY